MKYEERRMTVNKMVENFENMNKRTRLILSVVGVSAVIVPAILLLVVSTNTRKEPQVATTTRTVDSGNIQKSVNSAPTPKPTAASTPKPASPSASPKESTGASR